MKISGTAVLNAPIDQVWAAFNDPAVLARTIPGCLELREVGPDAYTMTVMAGVASIKGTYEGNVVLTEQNPPSFFVLKAAGAGAPGTVGADVKISLLDSATGGTDLSYDADAVVGGVIGGVGQRMLTGVAKKMAGQFLPRSTPTSPASVHPVRCPKPRSFRLERQDRKSRMPERRRLAARPSRAGTSSMGRWRAPRSLSPAWPWASLPGALTCGPSLLLPSRPLLSWDP